MNKKNLLTIAFAMTAMITAQTYSSSAKDSYSSVSKTVATNNSNLKTAADQLKTPQTSDSTHKIAQSTADSIHKTIQIMQSYPKTYSAQLKVLNNQYKKINTILNKGIPKDPTTAVSKVSRIIEKVETSLAGVPKVPQEEEKTPQS